MEEKVKIEMTAGQAAAFKAFQEAEERKAAQEKAKQMRADDVTMVDNEIESAIPVLRELSEDIKTVKQKVYDNFRTILDLKAEMFRLSKGKEIDVKSNTFTNSRGDMRITLGAYMLDNYLDTAEDGVAIVKEYISSLAKDDESQALVNMVLKLLAKDAKGTLKAQRIIQLRKIADESGNERFIEGVKIIEDAYKPIPSKTFVQAQVKNSMGAWENIPLGMTES